VWQCPCGGPFDLTFRPCPPLNLTGRPYTLWRYAEALPVSPEHRVTFDEGFTPLTPALMPAAADRKILLKQDHLFPTGSFKDRGAALLLSHAHELGVRSLLEDSSGNAGAAVAAYAARAGIACDVYVPESASPAKKAQIAAFGATVHAVPGPREAAADAARKAAGNTFFASHVWNPWFIHGTKTAAYEIWEQLGRKAPGTILAPTGNGTLLLGLHLGFRELVAGGLCGRMPVLIAVQTEAASGLARMWAEHLQSPPETPAASTIAEGIAVRRPARAVQIVEAVRSTSGRFLVVGEEDIRPAYHEACQAGWYIEPTSAVALAALPQLTPDLPDPVVIPLTGHGLKYTAD